jgi:hypothetical protein
MKIGHTFKSEHGFTGSADKTRDFRPEVPGYERYLIGGPKVTKSEVKGLTENETGPIEGMAITNKY